MSENPVWAILMENIWGKYVIILTFSGIVIVYKKWALWTVTLVVFLSLNLLTWQFFRSLLLFLAKIIRLALVTKPREPFCLSFWWIGSKNIIKMETLWIEHCKSFPIDKEGVTWGRYKPDSLTMEEMGAGLVSALAGGSWQRFLFIFACFIFNF